MIGGFNSPCSSIRNTSASVFPCTWVVREDSLALVKISNVLDLFSGDM